MLALAIDLDRHHDERGGIRRVGERGAQTSFGGIALAVATMLAATAVARADEQPWWAGFYAGGHVGGAWGKSRIRAFPFEPGVNGVDRLSVSDQQYGPAVGGLQAGWNGRIGGSGMFGIEADLTFPPNLMETHRDLFVPAGIYSRLDSVQSYGSLRGRVGVAFGEWLAYATGGITGLRAYVTRTQQSGMALTGIAGPDDTDVARIWRLGWSFGAGVEVYLGEGWSGKLEYRHDRFGNVGQNFPLAGQHVVSDLRLNQVRMGLNYRFGTFDGAVPAGGVLPNLDMFSIHAQTTQVAQSSLPFRARYSGPNSLFARGETRETISATAYLGFRPWIGTEFYFNPEPIQGFGLSQTKGLAGFSNGEAQKAGFSYPHYSTARLFMRQTIGFGGEQEEIDNGANQFGGKVDVSRLTFTAGKMAVPDIFDGNQYSHDQRIGFLNFAMWDGGAFDYAADQKGYTYGAALELNQKYWAARAGYYLLPNVPNGVNFDTRLGRRGQYIGEIEARYSLLDQPGKIRLTGWFSRGFSGSFNEVNNNPVYGGDITLTRRSRPASGVVANVEQAITDDLGFFSRLSLRTGRNEIMSFTDIDRSFAAGFVHKGTLWGRPKDRVGAAIAINALDGGYRTFLAKGGLGINIGDGRLNYRRESIFETYYALNLNAYSTLSCDYQYIVNPGYNADRGPANIFALRLHTEF